MSAVGVGSYWTRRPDFQSRDLAASGSKVSALSAGIHETSHQDIAGRALRPAADAPFARQAAGVYSKSGKRAAMMDLVRRLIATEQRAGLDVAGGDHAGFRVCEKLRGPLCTFAGVAGFRSLLSRALVLAKAEAPLLAGVQITPDGSFQYSPDLEARRASPEMAKAGTVLAEQLLGLLTTFIGEALTLRLVQDVWPQTALKDPRSTGK